MEDSIVERVIVLMEHYNLSASAFADKIDVQRSSMSHLVSGRNKPSLDFIQKVLNNFSDINPTWLIMGTGPMKQLDLFDIKGDVAPVEAIPAEKFRSAVAVSQPVSEQTAIKQSFPGAEIETIPEPVKFAQPQTVVQPIPAPVQNIVKEEPVYIQPPVQNPVNPVPQPTPVAPVIQEATIPAAATVASAAPAAPVMEIPAQQIPIQTEKSVQNDKKVVKIVFFYSDNTFESFNPQ